MKVFDHNAQHVLQIAQYAEELLGEDEEAQKKIARLYNEAGKVTIINTEGKKVTYSFTEVMCYAF